MSDQIVFGQNIIAIMWDFDKTLIPEYMQTPLFNKYKVDPTSFWQDRDDLVKT